MALTKYGIAQILQSDLGFPKKQSLETVESLLEIIKVTLEAGEDILISGFGKFSVKAKKERKGRNPATGQTAILPARRVVTFKWSGKLKARMNSK